MSIMILLVDDHKITRDGIRSLIEKEQNMDIIAEAEDGHMAIKLSRKHCPDVIIMDINMPGLNGIDATQQILSEHPGIKIIALSMYSERRYVIGMLKAGVKGYLIKSSAFDELALAIKTVSKNKTYLSNQISDIMLQDYVFQRSSDDESTITSLTSREREILQLIAEGLNLEDIAAKINVSAKTVSTHRRNIMGKLNIYNVAGLTKFAIREGITSLDV